MEAMMAEKVIRLNTLSKSIDDAVRLAAKRLDVQVDPKTMLLNWEIVGRYLRNIKDMNQAMSVADEISRSIKIPGIKPDPIVSRIGRDIFVGFIERNQVPRQFG